MNRKSLKEKSLTLLVDTWQTSWELLKITVPVLIVTRILEQFGLVSFFSVVLEPVMGVMGLPGSLGLVWATAMLTSLYGGIAVFAVLAPSLDLTVAQITVLCSAMLIAHALPIELSVSKKAGASLIPIGLLRLLGAVIYGMILHHLSLFFDFWQEKATVYFKAADTSQTSVEWVLDQLQNIALIVLIIFCILIVMRVLRAIGLLTLLEKILSPVLPVFGMGHNAAPVTVVGMVMGLGYGGAMIIRETARGKMGREELFYSMAMMGLCHGLVEDTLLMVAIGGKITGVFWGRILFSLFVVYCIVQCGRVFSGRRIRTET